MKRYHKKIYFPNTENLKQFCYMLNNLNWAYTSHSLEKVKIQTEIKDLEALLLFIKHNLGKLETKNIFEFYADELGNIEKICYRVNYSKHNDIILVIGKNKQLITVYFNTVDDYHYTLKEYLYNQK